MEQAKISSFQLFSLIILFELGSAVVVGLGLEAHQDAWISILIALMAAVPLFLVYQGLYQQYPKSLLTQYTRIILGKWMGWLVGFLYIVYFMYISARVLRDFSELILISWLPETPLFVISIVIILVIAYLIYHGIEVLARTGEIHFFIYFISFLIGVSLIPFSGIFQLERLQPIGENWGNIMETAFPLVFTFPFGEVIAFTMIFPYLNKPKKGMQRGLLAIIIAGLLLSMTIAIDIGALGANIVGRAPFPLLTTLSKISIPFFLDRLDILAVNLLIIGGFFKVAVFYYAAVIGSADLFKKNHSAFTLPAGVVIFILSLTIASNFTEHLKIGLDFIPKYIHLPMQVLFPLLLFCIALIKRRLSR